jgi:hypothetical protein
VGLAFLHTIIHTILHETIITHYLIFFLSTQFVIAQTFTVQGQIIPPSEDKIPLEGLAVNILKYTLNPQGALVNGGSISQSQTNNLGQYQFIDLPGNKRAAYRVSSEFEGNPLFSEFFFLKSDNEVVKVDIKIPGYSDNSNLLQISQVTFFLEIGLGELVVTEVMRILNPTNGIIVTKKSPLAIELPLVPESFRVMNENMLMGKDYEWQGRLVEFKYPFKSGETTLIFQYPIPTNWGQYNLRKVFARSVDIVSIYATPQLTINVDNFQLIGEELMGKIRFNKWQSTFSEITEFTVTVKNIPIPHFVFYLAGILVFLILSLITAWFLKYRLRSFTSQSFLPPCNSKVSRKSSLKVEN